MRKTLRKSTRRGRRTSQDDARTPPRNEDAGSTSASSREIQGMGRKTIDEWRQRCSSGIPSTILAPSLASTSLETFDPDHKHEELVNQVQHLKAENVRLMLDLKKAKVDSQYLRAENERLVLETEEAKNEIPHLAAEIVRLKRESEEAKKPRTEPDFTRRSWRIINGVLQLNLNIGRKRRKAPPAPIIVPDRPWCTCCVRGQSHA